MELPLLPGDLRHVLEHTETVWKELRGTRFFITGGTGFIGSWLLETLVAADRQFELGLEAVVLTRSADDFRKRMPHLVTKQLVLHQGDIRDFVFPSGNFTHVLHAAATSSAPVAPLEMFHTITQGTERALAFTVQSGAGTFLMVSSGAVYGRQPEGLDRIPESYPGAPNPADPQSAYGEGKRSAELLCAIYQQRYGLSIKIARCFSFVGPRLPLDAHFAIGNFIRDVLEGKSIHVQGDGRSVRSYLYAADLSIALWTLLQKSGGPCCVNIGSDEPVSIAELAEIVARSLAPCTPVEIAGQPGSGPAHRYVPDCSQARKLLGFEAIVSLSEGIRRTAEWARKAGFPKGTVG